MTSATIFDIVFAAGVIAAAGALAGASVRRLGRAGLTAVIAAESCGAVAAWVVFALHHHRELAVSAGGLTVCVLAAAGALVLRTTIARAEDMDAHLVAAQTRLRELVDREADERAAELERALARARADSVSLLIEEERRIAEEHRAEFADRGRSAAAALTEALTATQAQVEQRLAGWAQDLDRAAEATKTRIAELAHRQKQLLAEVEVRLVADADRLAAESDEQRAALGRIRGDLDRALEEVLSSANSEIEAHAADRRRALHELDDRLRRRERELVERIEREEVEATQRIKSGFEDVSRRQVEQMGQIVQRATATYSDEAAQQVAALVKTSREDAARRLAREMDRAVEVFAREAELVLAERLAHVGDAGAQRLERRLAEAAKALERQRDEWMTAVDDKLGDLEVEVRRRLEELGADADAERAVIEARLQELLRRLDAANALERAP